MKSGILLKLDSEEENTFWIRKCIELARLGEGRVSPNPLVGAVVVKNRRVVGIGFHCGPGTLHAERMAIDMAGRNAEGSTLYINLEPCVHYGHTPPCAPYIVERKIKRVVIGIKDPDKRVNGKGIEYLKKRKVEVIFPVLKEDCEDLNRIYLTFKTKKRPFIALKIAMSMDGKIALMSGKSRWISGKEERVFVHYLRGNFDGIVIGKNTFLKDNPLLTPRDFYAFKIPYRFVLWGKERFVFKHNYDFFKHKNGILVVSEDYRGKIEEYMWKIKGKGKVDIKRFIKMAYKKGITSLLVEGGAGVFSEFMKTGIVDEIYTSYSGKIIGNGISSFMGFEKKELKNEFEIMEILNFKEDIMIRWRKKDENFFKN